MRLSAAGLLAAVLLVALVAGTDGVLAQQRVPFGVTPVERLPAAVEAGGLTGWILAKQAEFYRLLTRAVSALRSDPSAFWTLVGLAFAYGVFHAAGPGHGKAVISAYIVANERALRRGVLIACLAALLQAAMAIAIVITFVLVMGGTARGISGAVHVVEIATFVALAAFGAWLAWRKARALRIAFGGATPENGCDHVHLPGPHEALAMNWREAGGVVVAAGLRPCAGAVIVLVFALSQGLFLAGGAAVLAMSAGTALTTSLIAALAVFMKMTALRLAAGRGGFSRVVALIEFLAALAVLALGLLLLHGYLTGAMPRGN